MRRFGLALAILLGLTLAAAAQGCGAVNPNCIVPTAPAGSNNNQAASTAFVGTAVTGILSTPNIWSALQTFTTINMGNSGSPNSFVDFEPNTNPAGYTFAAPAFNFNDLTATGWSFSDGTAHLAVAINGNKAVSVGVPNGTGSYDALYVNQNCQGMDSAGFCTGTFSQATAVFNPLGQNAGNYTGANPQVTVPAIGIGDMHLINSAIGEELDLRVGQNVISKQGFRIFDWLAGVGTVTQNSAVIRVAKAAAGGGWPSGIVFSSDYSAGYVDSGFPIIAGGTLLAGHTTSLQLGSAIDFSDLLGGFSGSAIILPLGTVTGNGVFWGASAAGGYVTSGTGTGAGGIVFGSGSTFFQFGAANKVWLTSSGGDGELVLLGTGTGNTTIKTANAGASNFTATIPAITDTLATLTAAQTLTNKTIAFASNILTGVAPLASPTFTGTVTLPAAIVAPVSTGTPAASLCLDASNNIIKKITAGSCI